MNHNCGGPWYLDVLFVGLGLFMLALGLMAWIRPESKFVQSVVFDCFEPWDSANLIDRIFGWTREKAGPQNLVATQAAAPLFGIGAIVYGTHDLVAFLGCPGHSLGIAWPDFHGPLRLSSWSDVLPLTLLVGVIGVIPALRVSAPFRPIILLLSCAFGFSAAQSAGFHHGPMADKWFFLAACASVSLAIVYWIARKAANPSK